MIDTSTNIPRVVHAKTTTTPVNPFVTQNNDTINSLPMVVGQNNSIPIPIVVEPIEAKNIIDLPIVVEPIQGKNYRSAHCGRKAKTIDLPIEAKTIDLSIVVEPIEAPTISDLPIAMEPIEAPTIRLGVSQGGGGSWYPK